MDCTNSGTVQGNEEISEWAERSDYGYIYDWEIGGIIGGSYRDSIEGCTNTGSVSGCRTVGGIAGYINYSTVSACANEGTITCYYQYDYTGSYAGGIIGYAYYGSVETSYNIGEIIEGSVTEEDDPEAYCLGGLIGYIDGSISVANCYNLGSVSGTSGIGGLLGVTSNTDGASIVSSYNAGTVSSSVTSEDIEMAWEIVTPDYYTGTIENCYYLASDTTESESTLDGITALSADQFASGEAAYLLNSVQESEDTVWYQTLETDKTPVLDSTHGMVYLAYKNDGSECHPTDLSETYYSNTEGTVVLQNAKKATCTEEGYTGDLVCTVCGKTLQEGEVIPAKGHKFSNGDEGECSVCGLIIGSCGDELSWELTTEGVLTISGNGAMSAYSSSTSVPWYNYRSNIVSVVLGEDVTDIGNYAFHSCSNLTEINLSDSLKTIGSYAFYSCSSLTEVNLSESLETIGRYALRYSGLK
ncbi:MAG: leucine-rich repeat domain-containing protein, partial [Lachnospiraceae bacterium]|nr:leucine-rich repeat domain-containing protein [Lachnospiraceae bacterium]